MQFGRSTSRNISGIPPLATSSPSRARRQTLDALVSGGFPYSKKLASHTSCVNSLAFSSGDGRFLASGGDDLSVKIWDFHDENVDKPVTSFTGPSGNVFALSFSATNRYLLSGGTDDIVLKYDLDHLERGVIAAGPYGPQESFNEHHDTIRAVSCHPSQDEVFLSGSENGGILYHDLRVGRRSSRAQDTLQLSSEVTSLQFHPTMDHIFATSESVGRVCLRDTRMAFGPLTQRTRQGVVQTYNTKITKPSINYLSNPEASSLAFDRDGSKLAVTMLHYLPTIYALTDPHPIATCSGVNLPDGTPVLPPERTYSNSCTMKHGSFGGPASDRDVMYSAGSDDFRGYIWKIPPAAELVERRLEVDVDDWNLNNHGDDLVGFAQGLWESRHVPVQLSTPLCRLSGHISIVNSTIFHPNFLHVLSAGIENHILLHSPTPSSPCTENLDRTSIQVRPLSDDEDGDRQSYWRAVTGIPIGEDENEDSRTLRIFDHLLRQEADGDVFSMRHWTRAGDWSSDEDSEMPGHSSDDETFY
ncbi:WD40 repeat-like protein [Pluteus cervinus]|uniref:WD40 repeat-like protein n=1 Tax=Pluteus cervinus TaxID=181527 RepID=A0ACD3AYY7_9AGAR|nr:WD40 repeat-like protein [Pluteus cervinus]